MTTPILRSFVRQISVAVILALGSVSAVHAEKLALPNTVLLVANKSDQTLGLIDPAKGKQLAAISECTRSGRKCFP